MSDRRVLMIAPAGQVRDEFCQVVERACAAAVDTAADLDVAAATRPAAYPVVVGMVERSGSGSVDVEGFVRRTRQLYPHADVFPIPDPLDVHVLRSGLKAGAVDVIGLEDAADELPAAVTAALERCARRRIAPETQPLPDGAPDWMADFIGSSPAMQHVLSTIQRVASTNVDVLIQGETGTGKEVVARAIHRASNRVCGPFVPVDCGAIPDNLLESEFFGYEQGAFTGADRQRPGLLECAHRGTFFMDEIGELPLLLQAKLLRTLQERRLRRVGGRTELDIDVRVVAATARDLDAMVAARDFREDLFYRINVVRIMLPPLRERGDDLGLLAEFFAQKYSHEMGKPVVSISAEAYELLANYRWPGNVRELQNVIRHGIALCQGSLILPEDLPPRVAFAPRDPGRSNEGFFEQREACINQFEHTYLTELLRQQGGNVKVAAEEAGIPRGTLYRLMKKHGIEGEDYR